MDELKRDARRKASAAYRQRVLDGPDAAEYAQRFRDYAADSARRRYQRDDAYREQKKYDAKMYYYYDNSYGQFLLSLRKLFVENKLKEKSDVCI